MDTPEAAAPDLSSSAKTAPAPQKEAKQKPSSAKQDIILNAHMNGVVVPMAEVQDDVFANCILGDGVAIEPSEGKLFAPADGVINNIFDTKHAIGIQAEDGVEILLHIGINTVQLGGKHFEVHVNADQTVKRGDLLVSFDMDAIREAGYLCTTPMIVCNTDDYQSITTLSSGEIKAGRGLLEIKA